MSDYRGWMYRRIAVDGIGVSNEFHKGVEEFLAFAIDHVRPREKIRCPCSKCGNLHLKEIADVKYDLFVNGFKANYTRWIHHGEAFVEGHNVQSERIDKTYDGRNMVIEAAGSSFQWSLGDDNMIPEEQPNERARGFYQLLKDSEVPIYDGHKKHTILSAVTRIMNFKTEHDCSERAIDDLLTLIKEFLPAEDKLPRSYYEVKKLAKRLNLGYEKIDACENDCMLFYAENKDKRVCDVCGKSRYLENEGRSGKDVPKKILRYFPLAPRLQRLFMSSHTAEYMRWHHTRNTVPDELSHPADGDEWKHFDRIHPVFSQEVRNVRLGLATDGFDPFGPGSRTYSIWPVIIVVYNLPPWMCMKDPYMFMTLLIPGDKSPGKDLNVYLRPLVNELKMLWDKGVETYDASLKQNFDMRAALLWTINDFPALGMISGWSTHGSLSCPVCMTAVKGIKLYHGGKSSYFGTHRQFLPVLHRFRRLTKEFNRHSELRRAQGRLNGCEVMSWVKRLQFPLPGKMYNKNRADKFGEEHNWTHICMFFELPYWVRLRLRHNLDVMHIEKNNFDNVFYTVLDAKGRTKDNLNARKDLQVMHLRDELHLIVIGTKTMLPKARYTLSKAQVKLVCQWVKDLKLPDGYSSNISRCCSVENLKFTNMKSHDCHVFMQRLMSVVCRDLLPGTVADTLIELSHFFQDLCSTTLKYGDLEKMEKSIVETICKLEMIFPLSFFDSMEHLPIHLAEEAKLRGPIQYRWMYPFER